MNKRSRSLRAIFPRWSPSFALPRPGSHELDCLATGIYFESKSEPLAGQLAVGKVIANRAQSGGRFPATYCGVLFQRGQFSFVHGHSLPQRAARQQAVANRGGDREDRRPAPQGIACRRRAVLPCALRVAELARQARRFDRQSRLLPLSLHERRASGWA